MRGGSARLPDPRRVRGRSAGPNHLPRPRRHDQRDRQTVEAPCEIRKEPERWRVRPMGVIDDHRQRRPCGAVRREPVQAVHDRESGVGRRRRPVHRTKQRGGRERRGTSEESLAMDGVGGAQIHLEQLPHDSIGETGFELSARAKTTVAPPSPARRRASSNSTVLPIPAGPRTTRTEPLPARPPASALSKLTSSCSRSSRCPSSDNTAPDSSCVQPTCPDSNPFP